MRGQQIPQVSEWPEQRDGLGDTCCEVVQDRRDFLIHHTDAHFVEAYKGGYLEIALRRVEIVAGAGAGQDGFVFRALHAAHADDTHDGFVRFGTGGPKKAMDIRASGNESLVLPEIVEFVDGPEGVIPS